MVTFEVFTPKADSEVHAGTIARAKATCLGCGAVLPPERVRVQLAAQRGGADATFDDTGQRTGGARMTAVVTLRRGEAGRSYRLPTDADYAAVSRAQERVAGILDEWERSGSRGVCPVPDEPLPPIGTLGFRVQRYGMLRWGELFTARQQAAFAQLARAIRAKLEDSTTNQNLNPILSMLCSKLTDRCNSLVNWSLGVECPNQLFQGNAIPMAWDFCESNILSDSSASISLTLHNLGRNATATVIDGAAPATLEQASATEHPLPHQSANVWFTDPPYYDAVPYADLSDFFLVWFKRMLPDHTLLRDPFDPDNPLSPKTWEAVQDESKEVGGRPKDRAWFEETMARAFAEGRRVLREDGIGSVVFAHKTTEGWEALLSGMIRGGWTITGSWPTCYRTLLPSPCP